MTRDEIRAIELQGDRLWAVNATHNALGEALRMLAQFTDFSQAPEKEILENELASRGV